MASGISLLAAIAGAMLCVHLVLHRRMPRAPRGGCAAALLVGVILIFLAGVVLGPIGGQRHPQESQMMQTCRMIALAEFQYANDNDGRFPTGASSTAVFQELMDGHYVDDPTLFYIPMKGKIPPVEGKKLQPENVCYDVTAGVTSDTPGELPLVFLTGFRIDYKPNGGATSLVRPFPHAGSPRWFGDFDPVDGLAVAYKNNNARFEVNEVHSTITAPQTNYPNGFRMITNLVSYPLNIGPDGFGFVPNVVPADFDAHGVSCRQLTPNGPLPQDGITQ